MNTNFFVLIGLLSICQATYDYTSDNLLDCEYQLENEEYSKNISKLNMISEVGIIKLNLLKGYKVSAWIIVLYSPLNMVLLLFLLISTILKQQLRKLPGDICIGALVSELTLLTTWQFIQAVSLIINDSPIIHQSYFCQFNSSLAIIGQIGTISYNMLFCAYLIFQLKYKAYTKKFTTWILHILIMIFIFGQLFVYFATGQTGKNSSAWCSFVEGTYTIYISTGLISLILILSIMLLIYSLVKSRKFKKTLNEHQLKQKLEQNAEAKQQNHVENVNNELDHCSSNPLIRVNANLIENYDFENRTNPIMNTQNNRFETNHDRTSSDHLEFDGDQQNETALFEQKGSEINLSLFRSKFFKFSNRFVLTCLLLWVLLQLCAIILSVNCTSWKSPNLAVFHTVTDALKLVYTTVLPLVRASEPKMKELYIRIYFRFFSSSEEEDDFANLYSQNLKSERLQIDNIKDEQQISQKQFSRQSLELEKRNTFKIQNTRARSKSSINIKPLIYFLSQSEKNSKLFRILSFLIIQSKRKYQDVKMDVHTVRSEESVFKEKKIYIMRDWHIKKYVEGFPSSFFNLKFDQDFVRVTAYSPIIFNSIRMVYQKEKRLQFDIEEELSIESNLRKLRDACQDMVNDNLLFFSQENKVVFIILCIWKAIDQANHQSSKEEHYKLTELNNPNSLLQPIIGIYQFEGLGSNPINVVTHLGSGVPSMLIEATYGLIGVMEEKDEKYSEDIVLRDIDFHQIENNRLDIEFIKKKQLRDSLRQDIKFLQKCKFIGYQLFIQKINYSILLQDQNDQYSKDMYEEYQKLSANTAENSFLYKNLKIMNRCYLIQIVDYLQIYDLQKKIQQITKRSIKTGMNTRIKNPIAYGRRFLNMVETVVKDD